MKKDLKANLNNRQAITAITSKLSKHEKNISDIAQVVTDALHQMGLIHATVNALIEHLDCQPQLAKIFERYRADAIAAQTAQAQVDAALTGTGVVETN